MAELVSIKRNVDVSPGQAAPAVFHCSQGDVGSKIILGLLNNGTAYSIPSGVTVTIEGSESNGSIFTPISATVSGSDITFYLTGEMTAVAGPAICQAVLKSGSNILGTANFTLEVESSPMGADAPPVFTDAGWTWMLNKLNTEFVPALGNETIIDAIEGKLDKNQGTANAGKYLKVGANGNVETADLDVTTDKTLSIADKAADAKAVGDAINKVKSEESKRIEETYPQLRTVVGEIHLLIGGGVAPETGVNTTGVGLARFSSAKILDAPLMVYMDSTEYRYDIWCYSGPGTGSATESPTDQQYTSEKVVVSNKEDNNYFKMGFKRIDGAAMTSGASDPTSDEYKILNTLRLCYMTDTTLTKKGIPADGKAVNDLMQQKLAYDTLPTENSTNVVNSGGLFNALRDGLFPHKTIASGQDINDYKNMGVWAVSTASIAANVSNWPCIDVTTGKPTSGTLLVITHREYNSGASFGFVQFAITARRIWYRRYDASGWQEWRYLYTDADFDFVDGVNSQIDTYLSGNGNALVSNEWLKTIKYYGHLFIDGINETATPVIPSESLYEIQMTKRLGFNIIEGHLQKTADDNYVVMHGDSGKLGYELVKVSDGSFDADIAINSLTLLELQTNYKYRSSIAKYQTAVGSADEWLQACTIAGMIPLVKCPDDTALQLVKKYCGNNFILYNGSRSQHKGMMMYYQYNLGATVADAKTTIDTAVENYGLPLMIETYDIGPNAYTLEDLTEIVQYAHGKGVLFGTTNCYYSTTISRCIKSQKSGTDICCSGWEIPDFDTGNLVNAIGDTTFSDFVTNGTVTGENLVLQNTNTVSISAQNNVQLGKGVLKVRYTGKIDIEMGKYWQFGQTYTGDGKQEIVFSTYFLNESPTFTLKAKENNTTIISIVYKASKC